MEEKIMTFGQWLALGLAVVGTVISYFMTHPKSDK
jgi:hypothetical protein